MGPEEAGRGFGLSWGDIRYFCTGGWRGNFSDFSHTDITGPIVLQTYRAIADYEKSSKSEMALKAGDMVDVVEKGESGTCLSLGRASRGQPWGLPLHLVFKCSVRGSYARVKG